ncbi:MAG: RusA family crossover junction endodeoxyribonuclease [Patescibacteria group bacterium]|nr:RusA family crossover junction endodeoxyribonuclease [Patescibacteria group bacterium]
MIELKLPWPVSANRYWRSFVPKGHRRAIVVLSDEAKLYKRQVSEIAMVSGMGKCLEGRVLVEVKLFPAHPQDAARRMRKLGERWDDTVRSIDLDNALKVTIDALKGIAYHDDNQVWKLSAQRMEPIGEACAVVTVSKIEREQLQPDLWGNAA